MRLVFAGTPAVAVPTLRALAAQHEIVAVVTRPDAPLGRKRVLTPSPVAAAADELQSQLQLRVDLSAGGSLECATPSCPIRNLSAYASGQRGAVVRIVNRRGEAVRTSRGATFLGPPRGATTERGDYQVEARPLSVTGRPPPGSGPRCRPIPAWSAAPAAT